jgi:hypothetical protein
MTRSIIPWGATLAGSVVFAVAIAVSTPRTAAAEDQEGCTANCARAMGLCMDAATTTGQIDLCADAYDCCVIGCGQTGGLPCGDGV